MKKFFNYIIHEKLLINLFIFVFVMAGVTSLLSLHRQSIPDVSMDMVSITTIYPGASPSDTEELISIPIEKKLRSVSDIKKVRAYNVDNVSVVVVFLENRVKDKKKTIQDIKDAVEQVNGFPANAQKPVVSEISFENTEIVQVAFTGKDETVPYSKIREFAKKSENFFYEIDGIAKIDKLGYYDREYLVEVKPDDLDKYRIGMNTIVNSLKMRNIDFPGGPLRIGEKEFILRTKGQFKNADEIRNTVIRGNDTGHILRIKDIAKVTDTYEEADVHHRLDGKKAIIFKLWKKNKSDQIDLSDRLQEAIAGYKLPGYEDINITTFKDESKTTRHRIASVVEEGVIGFVILGIFIFLLLGKRMSALVLSGIPITFAITFFCMSYFGITINIISLFGIIMVMGIMVDFSIVITENCHRLSEEGLPRKEAIVTGVTSVFWAVTVTLLCIIAAFLPLLLITGMVGKFVHAIPVVIICALIAGWLIAMFILPTYLNIFLKHDADDKEGKFYKKVISIYRKFVKLAVSHRYITVGTLVICLVGALALVPVLGFKFMPSGGEEEVRLSVRLPYEMNLDTTLEETKKIEEIVQKTVPRAEYETLHVYAGEEYVSIIDPKPGKATYKSTLELILIPEKERTRVAQTISDEIRQKIEDAKQQGIVSKDTDVKVEAIFKGPPIGKPINVEIRGEDFEVMKKIADEYSGYLKTIDGVRDIHIDLEPGKTEYHYSVNEKMAAWAGVSAYDIASTLNASFMGAIASKVSQNEEEVGVRVRFDENDRQKMTGLKNVKVANMTGGLVPLSSVSDVTTEKSYAQINRLNYRRIIQVQAELELKKLTPVKVVRDLQDKFHDIEKRYPGYLVKYGGEQEDTNESLSELGKYFAWALIFIYILITIFMRSLLQPLVVMVAIPFALIGVVFALFLHGQPFSFMSILGLLSLAGIIVSNTLVLVQFINNLRAEGKPLFDAIVEGGVLRFRPIILTAGAMVLELIPVMYGLGGKDYLVSPLALAFGYGLIFATVITLVLIPCFYHIAEDLKSFTSKLLVGMGREIKK